MSSGVTSDTLRIQMTLGLLHQSSDDLRFRRGQAIDQSSAMFSVGFIDVHSTVQQEENSVVPTRFSSDGQQFSASLVFTVSEEIRDDLCSSQASENILRM